MIGHGLFTTTEKKPHVPVYDAKTQSLQPNTLNGECQRLLKQSRRIDQAACLLKLLEHSPNASPQQRHIWWTSYGRHIGAMDADLDHNDAIEKEFSALRTEPIVTYTERLLQLKSTSKHFHDRYIKKKRGIYEDC